MFILQIIISILLTIAITMQTQTGGLGGAFGGGGSYHTKRGVEKSLFTGTIILAVLFAVLSLLNIAS